MAKLETRFVIHAHRTTRRGMEIHFDLRLEYNGVLVSWAIPKARIPKKNERLLSVRVPDHAISYYDFEGDIKSTYGKGDVRIHDKGKCDIISWKESKIGFELYGDNKKAVGTFWLIRMAGSTKNWLWIRAK